MTRVAPQAATILAAALFLGAPSSLRAQVMEPLSYTNAPIGLNFLIAGYGYLWDPGGSMITIGVRRSVGAVWQGVRPCPRRR
jgi:hypothetical protein